MRFQKYASGQSCSTASYDRDIATGVCIEYANSNEPSLRANYITLSFNVCYRPPTVSPTPDPTSSPTGTPSKKPTSVPSTSPTSPTAVGAPTSKEPSVSP